jgi:hypothetical protein
VPDTLTLEEEDREGLSVPETVGVTLCVDETELERHTVGLPLTVEVELSEAEEQ